MSEIENEQTNTKPKFLFLIETKPLRGGCCACTIKQFTIAINLIHLSALIYGLNIRLGEFRHSYLCLNILL